MSSERDRGPAESTGREPPVETDREPPVDTDREPPLEDGREPPVEGGEVPPDSELCGYTDYVEGSSPEDFPKTGEGATGREREIWDALYGIEDPEMPVSIVDLGLIYGVDVSEDGHARVAMTLTYSGCPARDYLERDVEAAALGVDGFERATVDLVWSPPWTLDMVTDQGKDDLREFGLSV